MHSALSILKRYLKPKTKKRNTLFSSPYTAFQVNASKKLGIPLSKFPSPGNPKYRIRMKFLLHPNKNPKRRNTAEIYFKKI
jgi:hypothetical protein